MYLQAVFTNFKLKLHFNELFLIHLFIFLCVFKPGFRICGQTVLHLNSVLRPLRQNCLCKPGLYKWNQIWFDFSQSQYCFKLIWRNRHVQVGTEIKHQFVDPQMEEPAYSINTALLTYIKLYWRSTLMHINPTEKTNKEKCRCLIRLVASSRSLCGCVVTCCLGILVGSDLCTDRLMVPAAHLPGLLTKGGFRGRGQTPSLVYSLQWESWRMRQQEAIGELVWSHAAYQIKLHSVPARLLHNWHTWRGKSIKKHEGADDIPVMIDGF